MFKKILCPLDGSDSAIKAFAIAKDMAKKYQAPLVILHGLLRKGDFSVLQHFAKIEGLAEQLEPEVKRLRAMDGRLEIGLNYADRAASSRVLVEVGQRILDHAKMDAEADGVRDVSIELVDGDPADEILRCIDEQEIDCVVMGSRGLSDIKGLLLGSVSHKVTSRASCTCIAVK